MGSTVTGPPPRTSLNIVLIGPPGAGKGTQARSLATWLHIPYVPTGDLFRSQIATGTAFGRQVATFIDHGELVPDDITIAMVLQRLHDPDCCSGVLLDGFPRNIVQAEALDTAWATEGKAVSAVLHMKASTEVVLARMANRWICPKDGSVYNRVTKPPKVDTLCDLCATALLQRPDETTETQRVRLEIYAHDTAPILAFYAGRGLVHTIDAERSMEEVRVALRAAIEQARQGPPRGAHLQ